MLKWPSNLGSSSFLMVMMPFFNRNWTEACSGYWVGPGLILGWFAGRASSGLG